MLRSQKSVFRVATRLNEHDEAFSALDHSLEERSLWMGYLNVEPQLDPLRADARFRDLLRGVGLIS